MNGGRGARAPQTISPRQSLLDRPLHGRFLGHRSGEALLKPPSRNGALESPAVASHPLRVSVAAVLNRRSLIVSSIFSYQPEKGTDRTAANKNPSSQQSHKKTQVRSARFVGGTLIHGVFLSSPGPSSRGLRLRNGQGSEREKTPAPASALRTDARKGLVASSRPKPGVFPVNAHPGRPNQRHLCQSGR